MTSEARFEERLLVLMPTAKDAERTTALFSNSEVRCVICADVPTLCAEIQKGAGAALLTEETILNDRAGCLSKVLEDEPAWSTFPLIVLTHPGRTLTHLTHVIGLHATLVERPVRFLTLQSVVNAALRHRRHQYEIRDILLHLTEQTEALRASEERFRALVSQATTGIAQVDLEGRFLFVNERFCEILGYSEKELLTLRIDDVTEPEDVEATRAQVQSLLAGGAGFQMEKRYRRKDGAIVWVSNSIAGVRAATGELRSLVAVTIDITARKESEQQLSKAQADLEETNRKLEQRVKERTTKLEETVAELEAFSYSISHDLRSPLRAMQGFAALLLETQSERLDAEGRLYLSKINASAARLDLLIQDVLAYSKVAKGEIELRRVDLGHAVHEVIEGYPGLKEKASIRVETPLPAVKAHPAYLTQCVSNLLGNAVKFVRPGVRPEVTVRAEVTGEWVRVWIEDNGIGIAPEQYKNIFEIFGRGHSDKGYEGTGIGLAIVKKAVERMGGEVGVISELGKGSRFWLSLGKDL